MAEWAITEGVTGCAFMLVTFKDIKDNDGLNVLWRLESALIVMDQAADNTTKTGAPFVKVSVSDMTCQIEARAGADVLCALVQLPFTPEGLKELDGRIEDGSLTFIRSTVYVQREVRADKSNPEILYVNCAIRAAYPDLFASTALRFETGLKPTVLPALLSKIKTPVFGQMKVEIDGQNVSVQACYVLLRGGVGSALTAQESSGAYSILTRNAYDATDTAKIEVSVKALSPLAHHHMFLLEPNRCSLGAVSNCEFNKDGELMTLHASHVFKMSQNQITDIEAIDKWGAEREVAASCSRGSKKRTKQEFALIYVTPESKRPCKDLRSLASGSD
ncbi:unnamed protein product [Polarella glacialis]|uniref:Uncharacterized protein n=1 Tax=Polarella glacialis TaxID=89957 RepID=A0A813LV11_POLGL|nr:unnamed protein product [Polarella glacialis]